MDTQPATKPKRTTQRDRERDDARKILLDVLHPGDTVYCILRHRSASGMMRRISFVIFKDGEPSYLDYNIGKLLGLRRVDKGDGLVGRGGGMDMGFHVVYSLGRALWPEGFGVEGNYAGRPVRARTPEGAADYFQRGATFRGRNGDVSGWDNDGGYALTSRWL